MPIKVPQGVNNLIQWLKWLETYKDTCKHTHTKTTTTTNRKTYLCSVTARPDQSTGTCFIQKIIPPPLPYFKVNICPLPLPHFASIFFAYLWSFRWPNYIFTLPRYFSFRLPHLNINSGPPSDELDKNIQRKSHFLFFSHWNGYSHFRSVLNWFRN